MSSTTLMKARIIVGTLMAAATVASAGIATSLALAQTEDQADTTVDTSADVTDSTPSTGAQSPSAKSRSGAKSTNTQKPVTRKTFAPARPVPVPKAPAPTHTKSKGS